MEIGTAKPTPEQRRLVPHHLIDVADPDESFDAAKYLHLAGPAIEDIRKRGHVPLVVGGTGLYMRVLTKGICPGPPSDPELKKKLAADEKSKGLRSDLWRSLADRPRLGGQNTPERPAKNFPGHRGLISSPGSPSPLLQKSHGFKENLFPSVKIFINREREALFERINRRVDIMIESGLKEEVETAF